jgi:hypothetical protein
MARRRLLNAEAWNRLLMPPIEERDMVRHFTLSREDLALIRSSRTEATQLGFGMLLLYLRCPGRVLAAGEPRLRRSSLSSRDSSAFAVAPLPPMGGAMKRAASIWPS